MKRQQQHRRRRPCHYQLGAPALIYYGNRSEESCFRVPPTNLPSDYERKIYDKWKSRNRIKVRWNYHSSFAREVVDDGDGQGEYLAVPDLSNAETERTKKKAAEDVHESEGVGDNFNEGDEDGKESDEKKDEYLHLYQGIDEKQQCNRLTMLLQNKNRDDETCLKKHVGMIEDYATHEHPYAEVEMKYRDTKSHVRMRLEKEPRLMPQIYARTQEFGINYRNNSDPAYLAPFDCSVVLEATNNYSHFRKRVQVESPERLPQGNALLTVPCPCHPCSLRPNEEQRWVLLHPKGHCLERLCVSNLVPPLGESNAGYIKQGEDRVKDYWSVIEQLPNEVDLDDTILEIRQCGIWDVNNPRCILVVRTGTHISVLNVTCKKPDHEKQGYSFDETFCWGCYVVEEKERIDHRSLSRRFPSFEPVSLTSHPRYGNAYSPTKFAFLSHTMRESASYKNVVHNCSGWDDKIVTQRHDISNLRSISFVDFTSTNPMCLWSAASSYVRPTLAPGIISKMTRQAKGLFGLGSSLYMIDLRTNTGSFQWSPSGQEMVTEGIHSISGILTDWNRDNTVYVTSTSAGKTWELDGRMPCRAVTTWSLTSSCDASSINTLPAKGFHGEPTLLTRTSTISDSGSGNHFLGDSPLIKVSTDFGAAGIHLFQAPLRKARFQTESLECVGTTGIDFTDNSSIATSSFYSLPEFSDDIYVCGVASLRLPLGQFADPNEKIWSNYLGQNSSIMCNLTITNTGDIFLHSLLENVDDIPIDNLERFEGVPVGTNAIGIPKELDGRTKYTGKCHWKVTGGMNIKLFLTNLYPVPRSARLSLERSIDGENDIVLKNPKKKRIDESADVIKVKKKSKSGITMCAEDGSSQIIQDEQECLIIPLAQSKRLYKPLTLYSGNNGVKKGRCDDSDNDDGDVERDRKFQRSDLSSNVIDNALLFWDETIPLSELFNQDDDLYE